MKYITVLSLLLLAGIGNIKGQKPETVNTIVKEEKPHSFFVQQAELWWKEIEKNNKNEKAWYNYYRANRYARITFYKSDESKKYKSWLDESTYLKDASDIRDLIAKNIPNTFTYYIFIKEGYPDDKQRFEALQKAYALEPDNPDTYDEFVVYYETNNLPDKRKEFNEKWFKSNDISSGILNYNYNVLMSIDEGGAILTFGDNDTFPIWMLQDVLGIRNDVTVLNVPLLTIATYRDQLFKKLGIPSLNKDFPDGSTEENTQVVLDHILKNKPAGFSLYISTPAWKQMQGYENNLYLTGLVMEYSTTNFDNIAVLINNFENKYDLDYVQHQFSYDISRSLVERMNVNYLPGIIKLYSHYKMSGEIQKAEKIKQLGLAIAEKGGDEWKNKALEILK